MSIAFFSCKITTKFPIQTPNTIIVRIDININNLRLNFNSSLFDSISLMPFIKSKISFSYPSLSGVIYIWSPLSGVIYIWSNSMLILFILLNFQKDFNLSFKLIFYFYNKVKRKKLIIVIYQDSLPYKNNLLIKL